MTDLPGHYGKVTSDKKMIFISHQRNKGCNRDYCRRFSVTFKATSKFPVAFLRLIFEKVGVDGVTGPLRKTDIRYESDLKVISKGLVCK